MINNLLEYKGYHTKIEYDAEDLILHGKIEGINDLVTFESDSAENIVEEFHIAVDDYLDFCSRMNKEPDKEFKGSFNVRVSPEIHKAAIIKAMKNNMTLNAYVSKTLENDLFNNQGNIINVLISPTDEMRNYSNGGNIQVNRINFNRNIEQIWN